MARKRRRREVDQNEVISLIELRCGIVQHAAALKAVTQLLSDGKKEAAISRLDSAVTALHALVRGQCAGQKMKCPACGSEQDVVAWVDDGRCSECGGELKVFGDDD
jgi:hypothetical protein